MFPSTNSLSYLFIYLENDKIKICKLKFKKGNLLIIDFAFHYLIISYAKFDLFRLFSRAYYIFVWFKFKLKFILNFLMVFIDTYFFLNLVIMQVLHIFLAIWVFSLFFFRLQYVDLCTKFVFLSFLR